MNLEYGTSWEAYQYYFRKPFYRKAIQEETRATRSYELSKQSIRANKKNKDGERAVRVRSTHSLKLAGRS